MVVCVGGDGHVAVESVNSLCCLHAAPAEPRSLSEGAACGGCADYSLIAAGEAGSGQATGSDTPLHAACSARPFLPATAPAPPPFTWAVDSNFPSQTVPLRC